jgi:hypothetical protein
VSEKRQTAPRTVVDNLTPTCAVGCEGQGCVASNSTYADAVPGRSIRVGDVGFGDFPVIYYKYCKNAVQQVSYKRSKY